MAADKKSPTCPACGAKFSHNSRMAWCNKCMLPDEVRDKGGRAIARWKAAQIKVANPALKPHGENAAKRKKQKHGRRAARICTETFPGAISRYRKLSREKKNAA